jgi:hypothetical protein
MADTFTRDLWAWLKQISSDPKLSALAVRVAIRLATHFNSDTGEAWPAHGTLADATGAKRNGVIHAIAALVERGHLVSEVRKGRGRTNVYRWILKPEENVSTRIHYPEENVSARIRYAEENVSGSLENVSAGDGKCIHADTQNYLEELSQEQSKRDISPHTPLGSVQQGTRQEDHSRAFDEFWQAYPLHKAKGAAKRAFDKAIKAGASAAEIIEGAKHYASEKAGQDPRYTKHPANWLNAECWADERKPAQAVTIDQQGNVIDAARTFERPKARSKADEHEAMAYGAFGLRGRS